MNWFKLLKHDLRQGLFRWRYLLIPLLFLTPCVVCRSMLVSIERSGTWMDYMMYCFLGAKPIGYNGGEINLSLPTFWLLSMGGCLFLNLDYMLRDLTNAGQQVIIRSGTRRGWYLAKCVWNLTSCIQYFLLVGGSVMAFTLIFGGQASLSNTPELAPALFRDVLFDPVIFPEAQAFLAAVLLPLVTLMSLSILQMTLCLLVKPVISFLISIALLVTAVYCNYSLVPGTGAMVIRSGFFIQGGISPETASVTALCVIILSTAAGCLLFQHSDILKLEE